MDAFALAAELVKRWEGYRPWPYPDPESPLAVATRRLTKEWGRKPAREIMARLAPMVRSLSGAPWTVGYGQTGKHIGPDSAMWTASVAEANLHATLEAFQEGVRRLVRVKLTPHQEAALISFAYNCGLDEDADAIAEGLGDSTLLKRVNAGRFTDAANEFGKWIHAGGRRNVPGLIARRDDERCLFLGLHPLLRGKK